MSAIYSRDQRHKAVKFACACQLPKNLDAMRELFAAQRRVWSIDSAGFFKADPKAKKARS